VGSHLFKSSVQLGAASGDRSEAAISDDVRGAENERRF
jgi:hypothetical protein